MLAPLEFRSKCVRHRVVDIQDDFCSEQLGDDRTEHQKVGHIVDVDNNVAPLAEEAADLHKAPQKETQVRQEISEGCFASILGLIQANHPNTVKCLYRWSSRTSQNENVHVKAAIDSCFGFPNNPG